MGDRRRWSRWLAAGATLWLAIILWYSIADYTRGLDVIVLLLSVVMQLVVVIAWWLYPRLPLWIVAGHGLIMASLALGLLITAPTDVSSVAALRAPPVPWFVLGTLPSGVAMVLAAALRWTPQKGVLH